ncbi:MAG: NAD(P)-dependent oxidoreductase [Rhodospirillaceae bacterium]|jgi:dihydropyrimidine dehydrogenase (NAD+) subunit PreT|nr:NAD(P)-dependent oxidoreductase [Rhodospirillaceae bacterium]MBT4488919.1 NAD(P)-dependent oxidoreductase [Rhodospirillaceae bacterium]MBT5192939.1 NAD(P)-dependent oxidoreductase [Rhodospirillaceae bacterium]MBT5899162.1 NAD(P)-dependent oxidoreductase [Rhodospirillaceae bacterium]MBT6427276.1 NAD(P)-dependent oxidoreductase [Rhodospirillaceae bacterium]
MTDVVDIRAGRLDNETLAENFADVHQPYDKAGALVEANRCYFCFDAPCIAACPTGIDIPGFIRSIATGNLRGAAMTILEENILGGSCARVCPTEILCQGDCVRNGPGDRPVAIGLLQRHATDYLDGAAAHLFDRAAETGKSVAVVGAGPAGLACAHGLARQGHGVTMFEGRAKPGGLNEYGIAAYKVADDFAQAEVAFVAEVGGIEMRFGTTLGAEISLAQLRSEYDAVFLGLGQGAVRDVGLSGEDLDGVHNAVDYIAQLRQAADLSALAVGRRIVVIGGGNTAIDIAVQTKRLGADDVTLVYRRGPEQMGATGHEQEFAQTNGVRIKHWLRPVRLQGEGDVRAAIFQTVELGADGTLADTGGEQSLPCDMVFKAVGQTFVPITDDGPALADGRIAVDESGQTSLPDVWAGGDCVAGEDLTVQAVQDGKIAARSIDGYLKNSGS